MKTLEKIFSVKNGNSCKIINFMGVKFKFTKWPIQTKKCKTNLKIPSFVPIKYKNRMRSLEFIDTFLYFPNYDFENGRFKNDYDNLIRGLDSSSIANVDKVIAIYKKYYDLKKKQRVSFTDIEDLFQYLSSTPEDNAVIQKEFCDKIIDHDNGIYTYMNYTLPVNHFESSVFYHRHSIDELKTLTNVKNKDIIDVGGFIGDSALVFYPYSDKNIYSFEASPENFELMKKTVELNKLDRVIPIYKALGDTQGQKLYLTNSGSDTRLVRSVENESKDSKFIESITLDSFVEENKIDVGLIKVDIEGFEQAFLRGAKNTIMTQKPALLISIYHKPEDYLFIKPLIESWNLGYKFKIICPPENRLFETLLVAEVI